MHTYLDASLHFCSELGVNLPSPLFREHESSFLLALFSSHHILLNTRHPLWMCYCIITSLVPHRGDKWTAAFPPSFLPTHGTLHPHRWRRLIWIAGEKSVGEWWWGGLSESRGAERKQGWGWYSTIASMMDSFIRHIIWMCTFSQRDAAPRPPPSTPPHHVLISSDIVINLAPCGAWWGGIDLSDYSWQDVICMSNGCLVHQSGRREPTEYFDICYFPACCAVTSVFWVLSTSLALRFLPLKLYVSYFLILYIWYLFKSPVCAVCCCNAAKFSHRGIDKWLSCHIFKNQDLFLDHIYGLHFIYFIFSAQTLRCVYFL